MPCRIPPRSSPRRRSAILVVVLWIVLVLTVMAYSLTYEIRIGYKMTGMAQRRLKAHGLARAGLAKGVVDLRNDKFLGAVQAGYSNDTLEDIWADTEDKTEIELGDEEGYYTLRITDEERKLDVSRINQVNAAAYEYILREVADFKDDEAKTIVQAIMDYSDADLVVLGTQDEDEVEYYTEWADREFGRDMPPEWYFRPKNERMFSIEELLEIPGITAEILYGDPGDVPRDPIERIDWDRESPALAEYFTVRTSGRININTAPRKVLEAVFHAGLRGAYDVETLADEVIELREDNPGRRGQETAPGIISIKRDLPAAGLPEQVIQRMGSGVPLSESSTYFLITSRGVYQGIRVTLEARVLPQPQVFAISEDMPESFGLRDPDAIAQARNRPNLKIDTGIRVDRMREIF